MHWGIVQWWQTALHSDSKMDPGFTALVSLRVPAMVAAAIVVVRQHSTVDVIRHRGVAASTHCSKLHHQMTAYATNATVHCKERYYNIPCACG